MLVELISTTTGDGISLDGMFLAPEEGTSRQGPVDAILAIHGSITNFYAQHIALFVQDLRDNGYPCLALNTRGHDIVWRNTSPSGEGKYYGNAFDILDDNRLDLRAGIDCLWERGYRRIGILGSSMGAVKVAYYAAAEGDDRVAALIPISPVRLSYSYYMASKDTEEFQGIIGRANELVAQGKPNELLEVNFPISSYFSAAAYLDKHGPAERYNLVTLAPGIKVPMLVVGGELETHTRLRDLPRDMVQAAVNSPQAEYVIIEGGNHALVNRKNEAMAAILGWLAGLPPQPD